MLSHGTSSGATCSLHHQHHDRTSTPTHPWPSIMPYLVVVIDPHHSRRIGAPAGPTPIFTHITPFASAHAGMTATAQVMFWGSCSRKHVRNEWPGWLLAPAGRPAGPAGPLCQPLHTRFDRFSDWRLAKAFAGVATPDLVFRLLFALLVTVPLYRPKGAIVTAKNGVMGGHHTHMRTLPHHPPPRSTVMFKDTPKIPKMRNLRIFDHADRFFCALQLWQYMGVWGV